MQTFELLLLLRIDGLRLILPLGTEIETDDWDSNGDIGHNNHTGMAVARRNTLAPFLSRRHRCH